MAGNTSALTGAQASVPSYLKTILPTLKQAGRHLQQCWDCILAGGSSCCPA